MGFFYTPPPRITKNEIEGTNGIFGHENGVLQDVKQGDSQTRLNERHHDVLKAIVRAYEQPMGRRYSGISAKELPDVMKTIKDSGEFNEHQIAHIEKQFKERL